MDFLYGTDNFTESRGNLIQTPVVNMYASQVPVEKNIILQSRPAITSTGLPALGTGPITAMFQMDGVLGGFTFCISGGKLYRESFGLIGTLDGTDMGTIDCFPTRIFANQGGNVYTYDGTTFAAVTTPGGFLTTDICVAQNRLILLQQNTGIFWWSDLLSTTVNALSFATAESQADNLLDCLYLADTLVLFGSRSVEFWPVTTDPNAPFQPLVGRSFTVGIKNTHAATKFNNTFAWATHKNQICMQTPKNIISNAAIEEQLAIETSVLLWTFMIEGTEFLAVRLNSNNKTYVYSAKSMMWSEFKSYGQSNFVPQCYTRISPFGEYFGGALTGNFYKWANNWTEPSASSQTMERTFRAGYAIDGGTMPLNNIMLGLNFGEIPGSQFGQGSIINMRTSKDGGQTWGPWTAKSMQSGITNDYRTRVQWRSQGRFSHPGILCEFQMLNNLDLRISRVTGNESYADVGV